MLGISEESSIDEIKRAYRDKVMLFHPDVNKHADAPKIFISIQKAYEMLSDSEKRRQYDAVLNFKRALNKTDDVKKAQNTAQYSVPRKDNTDYANHVVPRSVYTIISFLLFFGVIWLIGFIADSCDDKSNRQVKTEMLSSTNQVDDVKEQDKQVDNDTFSKSLGGIYIDEKGNYRNIPSEKVDKFLSKYPKARLATNQELSAIERKIADDNERKAKSPKVITSKHNLVVSRPTTGTHPYNSYYGAGIIDNKSKGSITVENGTNQDAVIIIYEGSTKKIIRNVYIRANGQYIIQNIPEGILRMKSMYGEKWASDLSNGNNKPKGGFTENITFADMASHEKFDMNWTVCTDGIEYPIYTITLHRIKDGNLQTKNIKASDFF